VLGVVRKALAGGISGADGKHYSVEIIQKDSQSSPQVAASAANALINGSQVDLMLTTSTPEVVNPVSDACEASGTPCISTVVPWEAWYFGRGLVGTPSDFGLRSEPPTHPELLDHLASVFMEGGWSVKKLHRHVLLSSAYRQASADRAECRRQVERRFSVPRMVDDYETLYRRAAAVRQAA